MGNIFCDDSKLCKNSGNETDGFGMAKKLDVKYKFYSADPTQMYIKLSGNEAVVYFMEYARYNFAKNNV